MTGFVFAPAPQPSVAIAGSDQRFPVRRIFCVGRNYAEHAREMGMDDRDPPFFFTKPGDAVVDSGGAIPFPPLTSNLHHEIELVIAIGKGGADIALEAALDHVFGYAVGIDLTRRDLQFVARDVGRPWDWGKAFDHSAPCGSVHRISDVGHLKSGRIWLSVDGTIRQDGNIGDLIWSVPEIIRAASQSVKLAPGDLIYTGTPAGVGPIERGQKLAGGIERLGEIALTVG
jgi:fumarylpyruvate hydrolase